MASRIATQRLDRVPSVIPARFPACDRSWQGVPPVRMSTGSTVDQSTLVMSPTLGTPGNRCAAILLAPLSISEYHANSAAGMTCWTAMSSPP
jgi:hypothetical protein